MATLQERLTELRQHTAKVKHSVMLIEKIATDILEEAQHTGDTAVYQEAIQHQRAGHIAYDVLNLDPDALDIALGAPPPRTDLDDFDPNTMNGTPVMASPIDETFNIGDRVEVKESISGNYRKGERGTVVKNLGPYVEVKLDEPRYAIVEGVQVEAQSTSFEPHELAHIDDKAPSLDFRKPGTTPSA